MNDILDSSDKLIEAIKNSDLYKRYIYLKEQMINDKEINVLIKEIKSLQKKIVIETNNGNDISIYEDEINKKIESLNNFPLYVEYDYVQKDLNEELQIIKNTIESCINDITN